MRNFLKSIKYAIRKYLNFRTFLPIFILGMNAMTQVSFAEVGASLSVSKMNSLDFSSASSQNTFSPQAAFESAQGVSWLMTAFILDDYLYLRKNSWFSESKMGQIIDQVFQRPAVQEEEMLLQKFMKIWYENLPEVVQNLQSRYFKKLWI